MTFFSRPFTVSIVKCVIYPGEVVADNFREWNIIGDTIQCAAFVGDAQQGRQKAYEFRNDAEA